MQVIVGQIEHGVTVFEHIVTVGAVCSVSGLVRLNAQMYSCRGCSGFCSVTCNELPCVSMLRSEDAKPPATALTVRDSSVVPRSKEMRELIGSRQFVDRETVSVFKVFRCAMNCPMSFVINPAISKGA